MKKQFKLAALAVVVLLTTVTGAFAQKGSKILSGTASYSKTSGEKAEYSVQPLIGYFVTNRVAVGLLGEVGENSTSKTTSAGAFARCHFLEIGKNLTVFSQLSFLSNTVTADNAKVGEIEVNLGMGANYSINKKWDLTLNIADLASFKDSEGNSTFSVGFTGVSNPLAAGKFGLIYKF